MVKIYIYSKNKLTFTKYYILNLNCGVPGCVCWYCWLVKVHSVKCACFYSRTKAAGKSQNTCWTSDKILRFILNMLYLIPPCLFYFISLIYLIIFFINETEYTAHEHQSIALPTMISLVHTFDFELENRRKIILVFYLKI